MSPLDLLTQNWLVYWKAQETRKSWIQWIQWFSQHGMPIPMRSIPGIKAEQTLSYQQCLQTIEPILNDFPQWLNALTSVSWLLGQGLILGPQDPVEVHPIQDLEKKIQLLQEDLSRLQQRLSHSESRTHSAESNKNNGFSDSSLKNRGSTEGSRFSTPIVPVMREREWASLRHPNKVSEKSQKSVVAPIIKTPLSDTYLSSNQWCDEFTRLHLDLQACAEESLHVPSSHHISFPQFIRRVEKKIIKFTEFQQLKNQFQQVYRDGFPDQRETSEPETPLLSKITEEIGFSAESSAGEGPSAFEKPSLELYLSFNDWLTWLLERGIDPQHYAQEPLEVPSSHQISFPQFCRRLERKLSDIPGFHRAIGEKPES